MRIELLVVPECPNESIAAGRLRRVLDEAGLTETVVHVQVVTPDTVSDVAQFGGSPTILVNGVDPFADEQTTGGEQTTGVGLSCRVYRTAAGIEGAPSVEQLRGSISG